MNWLHSIISEDILYALGWTLLHALWQGTFLSIVLSAVMFALNKHAAKTRYGIAVVVQFSMVLIAAATFWYVLPSQQGKYASDFIVEKGPKLEQIEWTPAITQTAAEGFSSFQERMTHYFESHLPLIVTLWLMGVLIFSLKMLGSLAYIQRLKTYRVKKAEAYWQEKVLILSTQMGIKKVVRLMESSVVRVPMAIGHLKPIILLPIGTITGLSPQQLEAILAHELAHIARHDYLVNILQSIVEIIFFYHPGVWWISKTIRQERENCCDDLAIAYNHDSLTFAKALTSLQENHWKQPELSMALGGKKSHLKSRIERVLHINHSSKASLKATFKEGFVTAMLLIFAIIGFSFTLQQVKKENEIKLENDVEIASLETDSSLVESQPTVNTLDADKNTLKKAKKTTEEYPEDEKTKKLSFTLEDDRYVFIRLDSANNIIEMFIEGKKIKAEKFKDYPEVIKAVKKFIKKEEIQREQLEKKSVEQERMLKELQAKEQAMQQQFSIQMEEEALLRQKMVEQEMAQMKIMLEQLEIKKKQHLLRLEEEKELLEKAVKEGKLSKLEFEERLLEFEKQQLQFKAIEMEIIAELETLQLKKGKFPELRDKERILREQERLVRKQAMLENRITRENVRAQAAEEREKHQKFKQVIFPELLKDVLIKSKSSQLHFKITENYLEINCKKQTDKLHKKYLKILKKGLDIKLKDKQKFVFSSHGDCN